MQHINIRLTEKRRKNLERVAELAGTDGHTATIDFAVSVVLSVFGCPGCGEKRADRLAWVSENIVECQECGAHYDPEEV